MIPDDYDNTDAEGEPICDCGMCAVLPWIWEDMQAVDEVRGVTLYRAQIHHHWHDRRTHQRIAESDLGNPRPDWIIHGVEEHTASLRRLFAYRRTLREVPV